MDKPSPNAVPQNVDPIFSSYFKANRRLSPLNDDSVQLTHMKQYLSLLQHLQDKKIQPEKNQVYDSLFLKDVIHAENALFPNLHLKYMVGNEEIKETIGSVKNDFHFLVQAYLNPSSDHHTPILSLRRKNGNLSIATFDPSGISWNVTKDALRSIARLVCDTHAKGAGFVLDNVYAPEGCHQAGLGIAKALKKKPDFLNGLHDDIDEGNLQIEEESESLNKDLKTQSNNNFSLYSLNRLVDIPEIYMDTTSPRRLNDLLHMSKQGGPQTLSGSDLTLADFCAKHQRGIQHVAIEHHRIASLAGAVDYYEKHPHEKLQGPSGAVHSTENVADSLKKIDVMFTALPSNDKNALHIETSARALEQQSSQALAAVVGHSRSNAAHDAHDAHPSQHSETELPILFQPNPKNLGASLSHYRS